MKERGWICLAAIAILTGIAVFPAGPGAVFGDAGDRPVVSLVPRIEGWTLSEDPQVFAPDSLYEYINGAAESYLAYEFRELAVAQFQKEGTEASMTVEIYDMRNPLNAFGIYSVERYPENRIVAVGTQGYAEDEVLNFFSGGYYVKLVCFNAGNETASVLEKTARLVAGQAGPQAGMPALLSVFPSGGLVPNSEKYIRKNVLGFDFLRNGYLASYKAPAGEFDAFIIEPEKGQDPGELVKRLLDFFSRDNQSVEAVPLGHRIRNKYSQQMEVGVAGRYICGVSRVPVDSDKAGAACFERLVSALEARRALT